MLDISRAVCRDGVISFCDMQPSEETLSCFRSRGDNQIMSLEVLSIALGARVVFFLWNWAS